MNKPMIFALMILLIAVAGAALFHHLRGSAPGPLYHVRTEFEFTVHAPYSVAAPLFGAEKERVWASDSWNPKFLYPLPAQDVEGAVFQVSHGHHHATWVNAAFDLDQGHVQYVYFIPDTMVTRIDIHLARPQSGTADDGNTGSGTTKVRVTYERTALNAAANEHVREFGEADRSNGKTWGDDIERYLATQRQH